MRERVEERRTEFTGSAARTVRQPVYSVLRRLRCSTSGSGYPRTLIENPGAGLRQHCACPLSSGKPYLPADLPHLLLRFESNGSHRHRRVAPFFFPAGQLEQRTTSIPPPDARAALRRQLRARRRAITGNARAAAAQQVARQVAAVGLAAARPPHRPLPCHARRAGYRATAGAGAAPRLHALRCRASFASAMARMRFFDLRWPLRRGAFGILEPARQQRLGRRAPSMWCSCRWWVSMPQGNRIGMGTRLL